uniref:HTH cro/C1-type domain-containing protein n=1 Tax=Thermosporothrix sp. COM3 TaxID=2490863 RepID=A0A455SJX0_9CHLR|nr:hypothetical protein KTC_24090 [Thermosporothrix sp. COM3]
MKKTAARTHPLRILRNQHNLTIEQLANEARVGAATIWRAEHQYPINAESRRRLCSYFGKTSRELGLIEAEESSPKLPAGEQQPSEQTTDTQFIQTAYALASLLDEGWKPHALLDVLQIILQSVQALPEEVRRALLHGDSAQLAQKVALVGRTHVSMKERIQLCQTLSESVSVAWQLSHQVRPDHTFMVAQALLTLLQQTHELLPEQQRGSLYAALYNLQGAAYLYQGRYCQAHQSHMKAHVAALEGSDIWNMAQSLNWLAVVANASGNHADALQYIQAALHLLIRSNGEEDERYVRLKAHLLADWAYNAARLHRREETREKLAASAAITERLKPNEEYDQARWYQIAGSCSLSLDNPAEAIRYLERSLTQVSPVWIMRCLLTMMPLAEAYARTHELEASLRIAERSVTLLDNAASTMLYQRFKEYQQILVTLFPSEPIVQHFLEQTQGTLLLSS